MGPCPAFRKKTKIDNSFLNEQHRMIVEQLKRTKRELQQKIQTLNENVIETSPENSAEKKEDNDFESKKNTSTINNMKLRNSIDSTEQRRSQSQLRFVSKPRKQKDDLKVIVCDMKKTTFEESRGSEKKELEIEPKKAKNPIKRQRQPRFNNITPLERLLQPTSLQKLRKKENQ